MITNTMILMMMMLAMMMVMMIMVMVSLMLVVVMMMMVNMMIVVMMMIGGRHQGIWGSSKDLECFLFDFLSVDTRSIQESSGTICKKFWNIHGPRHAM